MSDRRQDSKVNPIRTAIETVRLSRRLLLGWLASSAGAAAAGAETLLPAQKAVIGRDGLQPPNPGLIPQRCGPAVRCDILIPIVRPDDLLILTVALRNLQISQGPGPRQITQIDTTQPGVMLVHHQPQTIFEQAFPEQTNPLYPPTPPDVADTRMAGPSTVALQTPPGFSSLPYSLADLLGAFITWPMRLDVNAQPVESDPLHLANLLHGPDQIRAELQAAAAALKEHIAGRRSPATAAALQRAGTRLATTLSTAARQGRTISGAELDAAVASAVSASLGSNGLSRSDRVAASSYVQAVAAARAIRIIPIPRPPAPQPPHPPAADVTALEVPYQLYQTPLATAGWTHATGLVTHDGRTELWHSRLGTEMSGTVVELDGEPLRALWTPGYTPGFVPPEAPPWLAPMAPADRRQIVDLTANWDLRDVTGKPITPQPSLARRLMLSALGATLELDGAWPVLPQGDDLQAWNHRAATGRDYYVRLVYAGFLFPFGHAASFVQVTERRFVTQSSTPFAPLPGGRAAVLVQRYFIVVREPSKSYPGPNQAWSGRDFPFHTVEIATRVTPDLAAPAPAPGIPDPGPFYGSGPPPTRLDPDPSKYHAGFWPIDLATNQDFPFHLVGVDGAGRRVPFEMPLFFLSVTKNNTADVQTIINQAYPATPARTQASMGGAKIQFAPQTVNGDSNGDTNHSCSAMTFAGAAPSGLISPALPQFYPRMAQAGVSLASIKALLGAAAQPTVSYASVYLQNGFGGPNVGQVYLGVTAPAAVPTGPTDRFGGLVSPGLLPSALSRSFGAVQGAGAADKFASGQFDPADFLPDAKLLGAVSLKSVLHAVADVAQAAGAVPQLTSIELPDKITASYSLSQTGLQAVEPLFLPNPDSTLAINAQVELLRATPAAPKAQVDASLTDFKVSLFGFIILHFTSLALSARSGSKTDVTPKLDPNDGVMFGGPLEFVNGLRDVIPMDGFSDPPSLSVTPSGITASYSLGLPSIGLGVLSLSNVSLGAGFDLPFTGDPPSARFNFATRQSPFNLTVSLFGGGGFFLIGVGTGGVQEIEASLEFGAQISIDLGVASGGVYVKGGFYFHWIGSTSEVDFEGYVEMGGHLSVLGLISVSLVFHLDLGYQKLPPSSQLYGEASLTVEVSVLFFSASVSIDVKRTFAGSHSDPTFLDFAGSSKVWQDYCDAFA